MIFDPKDERDELLLEALLGDAAERERARTQLRRTPGNEAELSAFAKGLARAAHDLRRAARPGPEREARLVASILARTTRKGLSARAELPDSAPARPRVSALLRVALVSALLNVVAATALVCWVLREREDAPRVVAQAERALAEPPALAAAASTVSEKKGSRRTRRPDAESAEKKGKGVTEEGDEGTPRVVGARRAVDELALARERSVLQQRAARAPVVELAPDATPEARLLAARSMSLRARVVSSGPQEPLPEPPEAFGLALWAELELDRLVLTGEQSVGLAPACLRLQRLAQDKKLAAHSPGTATLVRAAEQRALGLGLLEGPALESSPGLLTREWFAALEQAGRESGFGHAAPWEAWLARGPE